MKIVITKPWNGNCVGTELDINPTFAAKLIEGGKAIEKIERSVPRKISKPKKTETLNTGLNPDEKGNE